MRNHNGEHELEDLEGEDEDEKETSYRISAAELRQFVTRYERLDEEAKDISEQKRDVLAEARGRGYDVKALKALIARRKKDSADVKEFEAILQLYLEVMEM